MITELIEAPDSLTVRTINTFSDDVRARLRDLGSVKIDISPCTELDISAVQLIEAARVHAAKAGKSLTLLEPARGPLRDLLARAGFLTDPTPGDIDFWFHGECPQ